jgi:hypothetical protein
MCAGVRAPVRVIVHVSACLGVRVRDLCSCIHSTLVTLAAPSHFLPAQTYFVDISEIFPRNSYGCPGPVFSCIATSGSADTEVLRTLRWGHQLSQ